MSDTYHRAKLSILNRLLAFPTINGKYWEANLGKTNPVVPGDLVSLSCAPVTDWYLSWVVEVDPNNGWEKYLLKSVEDGSLCWWENVGLNLYSREEVKNHKDWRWTDKQYKFLDRWQKVCRQNNAYLVLSGRTDFGDDDSVTLTLRERFGGMRDHDTFHYEKTFPSFKKTTMKVMDQFYLDGCKAKEELNEKIGLLK